MKSRSDELKLGKFTTLCSVLAASPAFAQDAAPPAASADHDKELAPIQIKGAAEHSYKADFSSSVKFTAPLVDTPKSVTVIPQELIHNSGAATLTEALRTVPGITFGAGEGGNPLGDRPFIRGYDTQGSMFVDGMRDTGATTREIFNTERIEITKGSTARTAAAAVRAAASTSSRRRRTWARRPRRARGSAPTAIAASPPTATGSSPITRRSA